MRAQALGECLHQAMHTQRVRQYDVITVVVSCKWRLHYQNPRYMKEHGFQSLKSTSHRE